MQKLIFAASLVFFTLFSHQTYSQWFQQTSGVNSQLYSVFFVNPSTGFAAGDGGKALRTTNGGTNWIVSTPFGDSITYRSVYFIDPNTGYLAGSYLRTVPNLVGLPKILKTTDAGLSWSSLLNDSGYTLWSVSFINVNTGFALGGFYGVGPNTFLRTTNAGANWQVSSLGNGYLFFAAFQNANTGFITSNGGNILKTTDSGLNWNLNNHFPVNFISRTTFIDNNTGFAVGGNSAGSDSLSNIYRTTNGGSAWSPVFTDHGGIINDVKFVNANTGFAIGIFDSFFPQDSLPSRLLKTTNSGTNWFVDTVFAGINGCISLSFADQNTGYAVGGNGVILKTTTGGNPIGIQQVSSEVPKAFYLAQNYPNPFNPSTKIKFSLPKTAFTKITIYDVLGREVSLIANEELKAGSYEVSWNADNFPSGVYFYRLTAGQYTETKKMLMIK